MKAYLYILGFVFLYSCVSQELEEWDITPQYEFKKVETNGLLIQSAVVNTLPFKSSILLLGEDKTVFAFDTTSLRLRKLIISPSTELYNFQMIHDTMGLLAKNEDFYGIKNLENDTLFLSFKYNLKGKDDLRYEHEFVFEDNNFIVTSCCRGEWGGAIFFEDKKTGVTYSTQSTCVLHLDTLDGNHYIYNYLGHLAGHSSVYKIGDVKKLPIVKKDSLYYWCNWFYDQYEQVTSMSQHDSVHQILLGDTSANKLLLDTFSTELIMGQATQSGVCILYRSEERLKFGRIEDGSISNVTTLKEDLAGYYVNYTIKGLHKQAGLYLMEFIEDHINQSSEEVERHHYILKIDDDIRHGTFFVLE